MWHLDQETWSLLMSNHTIETMVLRQSAMINTPGGIKGLRAVGESEGRLIGQCSSLKRLIIEFFDKEDCELVLKGIAHNRSIEELNLIGWSGDPNSHVGDHGPEFMETFSILSPFFEHNRNLRRLQLCVDMRGTDDEGPDQLVATIEKCSSLKQFQLNYIHEDALGGEILTALKNSKCNLTKLSLIEGYSDWSECTELRELIQSSSLEELELTVDSIDDEGAELLGRVLGGSTTLKTLVFRSNADEYVDAWEDIMTTTGWRAFFEFLKSPTCAVEVLELKWGDRANDFTAMALVNALKENTTLKTLKFWNNFGLTARGWCSFFTNVLGNPNLALEHLDVRHSGSVDDNAEVVDNGIAQALADALVGNKSLMSLDLTGFVSIGVAGRDIIMTSVQDLVFNKESLSAVLSSNHTLSELRLQPPFPEDHVALLQLNQNDNKESVVGEKIRRYYNTGNPTVEDDELLMRKLRKDSDLETKVMPFVLAWAGGEDFGSTLLYRLIRRVPAIFGSANGNPSVVGKRKRCG